MSDTKRKKTKGELEYYCAVEEFSDDILLHILSFLSLKEAAATSILSTRWRYLWRIAKLSLNFEFDPILSLRPCTCMELIDCLDEKRESYTNWVNAVVDQHSGDIDLFRVNYYLNNSDRISIDEWVKFALRNRSLERLELDFLLITWNCEDDNLYRFPRKLLSDEQYIGLKSLKVLYLDYVRVSGKHIHDILSNAPLLESLSVSDSPKLVHLRVSGQSLALKHLTIMCCWELKTVEICGVNLVSLNFGYPFKPSRFILRNVPMLVDLCYFLHSAREFFQMFSCCVSQLEVLTMVDESRYWMYWKNLVLDPAYPHIPNLKHLHLKLCLSDQDVDGGLSNLLLLLEAFPDLQKLVLHVPRDDPIFSKNRIRLLKYMERAPRSPHECLKEVKILGYNGFSDIERITYLIKHCLALEKIVINCEYMSTPRDLTLLRKEKILENEELARTHAMTQLKRHIPSNIEFVCL